MPTTESQAEAQLRLQVPCRRCRGARFVYERCRNHATCDYVMHTLFCPACDGKGYYTAADRRNYLRREYCHDEAVVDEIMQRNAAQEGWWTAVPPAAH